MGHGYNGVMSHNLGIGIIIFGFAIVIFGVIWLIHRKRVASDGLTPKERKELDYPEKDILSMLRQHGRPMMQSEIIDTLPGDLDDLAEVISAMEEKGYFHREWNIDQGTYIIRASKI
jgi:septation ring formation regulator EzrA